MKSQRHRAILTLVEERPIETQEELALRLKDLGFPVTQATVSRDIKELRLLKVSGPHNTYRYAAADHTEHGLSERLKRIFIETAQSVAVAENLLVVKTLPGTAGAAAEMIDTMRFSEVLGTLAGDNTLLVIAKDRETAQTLCGRFQAMMH